MGDARRRAVIFQRARDSISGAVANLRSVWDGQNRDAITGEDAAVDAAIRAVEEAAGRFAGTTPTGLSTLLTPEERAAILEVGKDPEEYTALTLPPVPIPHPKTGQPVPPFAFGFASDAVVLQVQTVVPHDVVNLQKGSILDVSGQPQPDFDKLAGLPMIRILVRVDGLTPEYRERLGEMIAGEKPQAQA